MLPKNTVRFPGIDPVAWEHPADRAALSALRQVRGLDELVGTFISLTTERSMQLMHYASSVKVGPSQFPKVNSLVDDLVETFDWGYRPTVFVTQSPFFNAHVFGAKEPFIVLNSSLVRGFDISELKVVLAHEFGHLMSGHSLYKTLAWLLANVSLGVIPLGEMLVNALQAALAEWDRKSELSADRVGLLASQAEDPSFAVLMRMAGGEDLAEVNLNDFFAQAREFEERKSLLDGLHKMLNQAWMSHPYPVVRLQELKAWSLSGGYGGIMSGVYPKRGESRPDAGHDAQDAFNYYKKTIEGADDPISKLASGIGDGIEKAVGEFGDRLKNLLKP
ncbi:MAG: M48 family metallopeptidase [Spirochaetota bacterium]